MNDPLSWVYTGGVEPNVMAGATSDPWAARKKWLGVLQGSLNKQAGNSYQGLLGDLANRGGEGSGAELTGEAALKTAAQEAYSTAQANSALDIMKMLRGEEQAERDRKVLQDQAKAQSKWGWLNTLMGLGKTAAGFI